MDSLWLVDHFLWRGDPWRRDAYGASENTPRLIPTFGVRECWTTLAALAGCTNAVRLGTIVTCTTYRNPALLAKMADTVDEISGGRLVLGLGAGDHEEEHYAFGYSYERRVARFEEALNIIVPLLRNGSLDYDGEFYSVHDCELRPRGPRASGPPILIGSLANGPRMLRLLVQHADIWNGWVTDRDPTTAVPALCAAVDEACSRHGRDPATLERSVVVALALSGPMTARDGVLTGDEDDVVRSLLDIAAMGIDEIQLALFPTDLRSVGFLGRVIDKLRASPVAV